MRPELKVHAPGVLKTGPQPNQFGTDEPEHDRHDSAGVNPRSLMLEVADKRRSCPGRGRPELPEGHPGVRQARIRGYSIARHQKREVYLSTVARQDGNGLS